MATARNLFALSRPLIFTVIMAAYMAGLHSGEFGALAVFAVSTGFFLAASALLVGWIPAPLGWRVSTAILEIGWVSALAVFTRGHGGAGPIQVLFIAIAITLPRVLPRRWWGVSLATIVGLLMLTADYAGRTLADILFTTSINALAVVVAGVVSILMVSLYAQEAQSDRLIAELADSRTALERAHRQLQESAAHQQQMAVLEERQRLAREIHDNVAHGLTVLVVQIQAGRRLLEKAPDQAPAVFERCEALAREALTDTRSAVRALHSAAFGSDRDLDALQRLGRDFGMATGVMVSVGADESAKQLAPDAERVEQLYRIFQEALVNAHRHGGAHRVEARLCAAGGELSLTISNDGRAPDRLLPGVGLQSMAARAESLGGRIRYEPGEAVGMTIYVTVPLREGAIS